MSEASKLYFFKIVRDWPGMTPERVQKGADLIQIVSNNQKALQETLKLSRDMKT
jgi:hypothetical protein